MDQLELVSSGKRRRASAARKSAKQSRRVVASSMPVARLIVDVKALAVDREFDYAVPADLDHAVSPGCRVRVRFNGRLVDAFVIERVSHSVVDGALTPITRVVSEPILTSETLVLARAVATRYGGSVAEVLRDAIPPRASRSSAQAEHGGAGLTVQTMRPELSAVQEAMTSSDQRLRVTVPVGVTPHAWLTSLAQDYSGPLILLVPDHSYVQRLRDVRADAGTDWAYLSSGDDSTYRNREFLRVVSGDARVVVGTRHCVFAPLPGACVVLWDDCDPSYEELRSPGWHAREVAALRAHMFAVPFIIAGYSHSVEAARLVSIGWLTAIEPTATQRRSGPLVRTSADARPDDATATTRIPHFAWRVLRDGLAAGGPVLVQVGRSGYYPSLKCVACGAIANCQVCSHALGRTAENDILCPLCGWDEFARCADCGEDVLKSVKVGSSRTAHELAQALPGRNVIVSSAKTGIVRVLPNDVDVVVATVGAEPVAPRRYQAALLLDGDALLARADLRTEEQTLRRWLLAAALVRDRSSGGTVAVTAHPSHRCVQALVRYDVATWEYNELVSRTEAGLPPSVRCAVAIGGQNEIDWFASRVQHFNNEATLMGPMPATAGKWRVVVLVPLSAGAALSDLVSECRREREGRKDSQLRIRIDPLSLFDGK